MRAGLLIGFFSAMMIITHMLAISRIEAAYMITIKRTSAIFAVLYGSFLFKETNISERLAGAFVMVCGVVWICLMK